MKHEASMPSRIGAEIEGTRNAVRDAIDSLAQIRARHPPVRNVNETFRESFSPLERVALFITVHIGSFGFFLIIVAWTVLWLAWNTIGPKESRFDPAPAFVLWLFI